VLGEITGGDDCGDIVLSRFDPQGNLVSRVIDVRKSSQNIDVRIAVDSGENVVLIGDTYGEIEKNERLGNENTDVPLTDPQRNKRSIGVWFWDSSGTVTRKFIKIDKKHLGVEGVAFDANGDILVVGSTEGAFSCCTNNGGDDAFIMLLSRAGLGPTDPPAWVQMLGTPGNDSARGVATAPNGKFCIAGSTRGSLFATSAGGADAFLACYSGSARTIARQYGSPADEGGRDVAFDKYGDIFVAGDTTGRLGTASYGGFDIYVAKFSPGGNPQ
jgi:hypothetical protein